MVRRSTAMRPSAMVAARRSSSSSGSFISQCASRRSNSACGPPPSKPRAHSQTWSDRSSATRPLRTLSSTSSGRSPGPLISVSPPTLLAPMTRNQRPPARGGRLGVGAGQVARHRMRHALRRHRRFEALRHDLAGRLRRQHGGERRMRDAHRPGEFRPRRHQQRPAIVDIVGEVLEIGQRQYPALAVAVEDHQVETVELLAEQFLGRKGDQRQLVDRDRRVLLARRPQNREVDQVDRRVGL